MFANFLEKLIASFLMSQHSLLKVLCEIEIRDFGFSKDQKYHSVQIVLALVVDAQGMPIAYEVFKGNLA